MQKLNIFKKYLYTMPANRIVMTRSAFLLAWAGLLAQPTPTLAADRLATIQARGEVRVCIWPDYYSITFRNPRTGVLEGLDIDMAHAFADDLGVDLTLVDSSFADLIPAMTEDRCDIAMHAVGVRPERAEYMAFSEPYLTSGIYGVSDRNIPAVSTWQDIDKPGRIVVVQKGTYMEPEMRQRLQHATLMVVDQFKAREDAVESGRADVFMTDYPYGRRMVDLTDWGHLLEPPEPVAPTDYAYAVPRGEADWLARVNTFVKAIKADGRLAASAERHGLVPILAE